VLQCAAVYYSVLQCVAVCCSVLQCVEQCMLQCFAVCCSVLQCVAVSCVLCSKCRLTSPYIYVTHALHMSINIYMYTNIFVLYICMHKFKVLQCVAVCCSVLQCVAVCCSVLQCVAVCCSVFVLYICMHMLSIHLHAYVIYTFACICLKYCSTRLPNFYHHFAKSLLFVFSHDSLFSLF